MCEEYNGWTNYQTWNVALWLDNDPYSESTARTICRQAPTGKPSEAGRLLRDWIDDLNPLTGQTSMFSDILSHALHNVDWEEIAAGYLVNLDDEDEDDEDEDPPDLDDA